jgi:two-component system, chemotaxis family, protein-glutamate methylesterase/glutaminase
VFTCPECGGTLWELEEGKVLRYRCHTGHSFSVESLLLQQDGKLENALWNAARVMQEKAVLRRHLAHRVSKQGLKIVAASYLEQAKEAESNAATIRRLADEGPIQSPPQPDVKRKHQRQKSKKRRTGKQGES